MYLTTVIIFLILSAYVIKIIQSYSQKQVTFMVKVNVWLTWILSIGMVLLLPLDIYVSKQCIRADLQPETLTSYKVLQHCYFWAYYLNFFLCWTIVPLLQGYEESGYRKTNERLCNSLKVNGIFYLVILVAAILFLWLVIALDLPGQYDLMTFIKSAANCWGIFLIMVLLGYGLVNIPQSHWRTTNHQIQMKYFYFRAALTQQEQKDCINDLLDNISLVQQIKETAMAALPNQPQLRKYSHTQSQRKEGSVHSSSRQQHSQQHIMDTEGNYTQQQLKQNLVEDDNYPKTKEEEIIMYCDDCIQMIPKSLIEKARQDFESGQLMNGSYVFEKCKLYKAKSHTDLSVGEAIDACMQTKRAYAEVKRSRCNWKKLMKSAFQMEDTINCENSSERILESVFRPRRTGFLAEYRNTLRWYWYCRIKRKFKIFWAILLGVFSFVVLLTEVTVFFEPRISLLKLLLVDWILEIDDLNAQMWQIWCLLPLAYMIWVVYYGLFKLNLAGFYGLYPDHNTDSASFLWTSINFSRVSAPLCFNFLDMIGFHQTAYNSILGNINLVPLVGNLTSLFPVLMFFFAIVNYFDLWSRFLTLLKIKKFQFSESFNDRYIDEGKDILKIKRAQEEKKLRKESLHIDAEKDRVSMYMRFVDEHELHDEDLDEFQLISDKVLENSMTVRIVDNLLILFKNTYMKVNYKTQYYFIQ